MALDDILKQVPIDDIAAKLGVSPAEASKAVEQGGAVLLSGLAKNAQTEEGSAAIQSALRRHEGATSVQKVDDVDQTDGGKIVKHVLGDDAEQVAAKLNSSDKTPGIDFGKLLPILAPIIMGLIANKNKSADGSSGGGLGDIIGGLLGGGNAGGASSGGGLGDILGGILGGGSSSGGGGIGDILGGLFGGKK
ncbi:DUF937 domain-containing protein [Microbacterium sp. NPDC077644]|uniref:DUF937 domain-containing protein n=1 Tax=Microbacterium tenebrionis TaxID=2830665 RepID=A0A9X1LND5_9MICO|nr:DUF937 domain-containing protein [Microbacterium tenebrionis]MCC2028787.1 DUF937 domain-containing protein [Microbacterium tenebrionis]